jgi:hypothetical protein
MEWGKMRQIARSQWGRVEYFIWIFCWENYSENYWGQMELDDGKLPEANGERKDSSFTFRYSGLGGTIEGKLFCQQKSYK